MGDVGRFVRLFFSQKARCLIQLRPLDYRNPGDASLWFSVCFFSRKHFWPSFHPHVKKHLTEGNVGNEGLGGYGDYLHCLFDRIDGIYWIILNREGARDAKGVFGWSILILEERPRIKIPNRFAKRTTSCVSSRSCLRVS